VYAALAIKDFYDNTLSTKEKNKEYYKKLAFEAVDGDEDGRITKNIQLWAAAYLGKPVPWIDALG
jgi:hypothetical protein